MYLHVQNQIKLLSLNRVVEKKKICQRHSGERAIFDLPCKGRSEKYCVDKKHQTRSVNIP